jgi:hypothetical protein
MSVNLVSAVAVKQFDTEVKQAFQQMTSVLAGAYRERLGVVGTQYNFRKMGSGQARKRTVPQSNVTPMDISHSLVPVTLEDWDASEYTDIFKQAEMNFSERQELSSCIAAAMARRKDQNILDAIITTTSGYAASGQSIAKTTGGTGGANMNVEKLRKAKAYLDKKNVPKTDRFCLMHANQAEGLLQDPQFISGDYNNQKVLADGSLNSYLGFQFIVIGDLDEGGIPLRTADRYSYCWHKTALGAAFGSVMETEVNYIPEKKSYLCSSNLKMGAVAIEDVTGMVRIDNVDAAAYNA